MKRTNSPLCISAKEEYQRAKRTAKREVWVAKSAAEKETFAQVTTNCNEVFKIAKQMRRLNQDVVGEKCVRNDAGELSLGDDQKLNAWVEHYNRLLNVEFDWPMDSLPDLPPVQGPRPAVTTVEIAKALSKMKPGKAAGPSGVVSEMLKACGDRAIETITDLTEAIFREDMIPDDWQQSFVINLFKGKGDALVRGNYRGLKLTDQVMKVLEHVVERQIRQMVNIDEMQYGFVPGRGTTDAIFVVRQLQEKFRANKKPLYFCFVDLEKAFDRVPRKVIWWAMRKLGVEEWLIRVVQAMYNNSKSRVRVNGQLSDVFNVNVGVHQGSVLSPLLFILVMEALSREFRTGVPWELLYADDLVIVAETLELCIEKYKAWKLALENKGLHVNTKKTKFMVSDVEHSLLRDSGAYPCAVCRSGVGANSIRCSVCSFWVHKKCSGIVSRLKPDADYKCPRCCGTARPIDGRSIQEISVDGVAYDVECSFCYLGDMLCAEGGCDLAATTRYSVAWGKFREILPVLTSKHISLKTRGRIFSSVVRATMLHGSETWAPTAVVLQRLHRNDRAMIRWICGTRLGDRIASDKLLERLGLQDITDVVRTRRLRWYGHVVRSSRTINSVRNYNPPGKRSRGRPAKTWSSCVKEDLQRNNLKDVDPLDRVEWRRRIKEG